MIFTMMSTTVVHAQSVKDGSNEVTVTPNVGVSYVSPEETIETRGTSRPSKVWNIKSKGQYDFAGSSHYQNLYTNYKFTGKTSYKVYVENTGDNPITVTAKRLTKTYGSTKLVLVKLVLLSFLILKAILSFILFLKEMDTHLADM